MTTARLAKAGSGKAGRGLDRHGGERCGRGGAVLDYPQYITSDGWRKLRLIALERDGHRCRICNASGADARLEVHHRYYPPKGRWDLDCVDALTVLCVPCHDLYTNIQREQKYANITLATADVVRLAPITEVNNERIPDVELSDYRRISVADAQRPTVGPAEPVFSEPRRSTFKAEED